MTEDSDTQITATTPPGIAGAVNVQVVGDLGTDTLIAGFTYTSAATVPDDAQPIPASVQAYGRFSEDASCQNGWGPSWQSWAEKITGGWVCTRSIPSLG